MNSSALRKAEEFANRECPYPRTEPWAAGLAAGWLTFLVIWLYSQMVGVSENRMWPALAPLMLLVGGLVFLDTRQRARRHVKAYRHALKQFQAEAARKTD